MAGNSILWTLGAGRKTKLVGLMLLREKKLGEAKRNRYSKEFKFKVAIAAFRDDKQLSELASELKNTLLG